MGYIRTIALVYLVSAGAFAQSTWYVPDDFGTIQEAINASIHGDMVVVRPGTYVENIDFIGKAITVKSELGADVTTINGNRSGSVVIFQNGEGHDSVLEGFRIMNGSGTLFSSLTEWGGGIFCCASSPTIIHNTITSNTAYQGPGIECYHDNSIIMHNEIRSNSGVVGGGICTFSSTVSIAGNLIESNFAFDGGAIYCCGGAPHIESNVLRKNTADGNGGGIYIFKATSMIVNNLIHDNTVTSLYESFGGGIFCRGPRAFLTVVNNTITDNYAYDFGSGLFCCHDSDVTIVNTILWNTKIGLGQEIYVGGEYEPSRVDISYSDVRRGESMAFVEPNCILNWGSGMIDADPLYVNHYGDDFHITHDSPCLSAGDMNAPSLPQFDFEGDPRSGFLDSPDIGADEFHTHLYVTGKVASGNPVTGVIIGWPGTKPVMLISGSGVLPVPVPTPFGDFWLEPPWEHRVRLHAMPDDGVQIIDRIVPTGVLPGVQIPLQALVGRELSNLWVVEVE